MHFLNFILLPRCHVEFLHFDTSAASNSSFPSFLDSRSLPIPVACFVHHPVWHPACHHRDLLHPISPLLFVFIWTPLPPLLYSLGTLDYNLDSHFLSHIIGPYYFLLFCRNFEENNIVCLPIWTLFRLSLLSSVPEVNSPRLRDWYNSRLWLRIEHSTGSSHILDFGM